MFTILTEIGGIATAIIALITCLSLFVKPCRKTVLRLFGNNKALLALLRNEITGIYYKYLPEQKLQTYVRENLMALNDAYLERGGNSYVTTLVKDMLKWDVVNK